MFHMEREIPLVCNEYVSTLLLINMVSKNKLFWQCSAWSTNMFGKGRKYPLSHSTFLNSAYTSLGY